MTLLRDGGGWICRLDTHHSGIWLYRPTLSEAWTEDNSSDEEESELAEADAE